MCVLANITGATSLNKKLLNLEYRSNFFLWLFSRIKTIKMCAFPSDYANHHSLDFKVRIERLLQSSFLLPLKINITPTFNLFTKVFKTWSTRVVTNRFLHFLKVFRGVASLRATPLEKFSENAILDSCEGLNKIPKCLISFSTKNKKVIWFVYDD